MTVRTRLTFFVIFAALSFAGVLFYLRESQDRQSDLLLRARAGETRELVDDFIQLTGGPLATYAGDYTRWGEMVDFVHSESKEWGEINIASSLASYGADAAWVTTEEFRTTYAANGLGAADLGEPPVSPAELRAIFAREQLPRFFAWTAQGLMEVYGAGIVPSEDLARRTPPRGYYLVARLWDERLLDRLSGLAGGQASLVPPETAPEEATLQSAQCSAVLFRSLPGWQGSPTALLRFSKSFPTLQQTHQAADSFFLTLSIFAAVLVLLLFACLTSWVNRPLAVLSRCLAREDPALLEPLAAHPDEFGRLAQLVSQFLDERRADLLREVSERRLAEEELARQRDFIVQVLDALPLAIHVKDREGRFQLLNRMASATYGLARDEAIGQPDLSVLPPEVAERFVAGDEEIFRARTPVSFDTRLRVDGEDRWFLAGKTVIPGEKGDRLLGYSLDITERKETERELAAQKDFVQQVIDTDPNLIFVRDWDGNFLLANRTVTELFGVGREELLRPRGSAAPDALPAAPEERVDRRVIRTGRAIVTEESFARADGEARRFQMLRCPLRHPDGETHVLTIGVDITERERVKEELIQARDTAEAATRAKSEFLANVSHELRTPLHGILSYARFGLKEARGVEPPELGEYFRNVEESGASLLALLNDLLDLSRLESGHMRFDFEEADLRLIADTAAQEFELMCDERGVQIRIEGGETLPPVVADRHKLLQVVRNLVSNAIKFSAPGGEILVSLSATEEEAEVAVRDEGVGIPPDELEAVFDKFVQSRTTKSGAGGTGLGLAICREISAVHDGRIWAERNPDRGVTVRFRIARLPARAASEGPAPAEKAGCPV